MGKFHAYANTEREGGSQSSTTVSCKKTNEATDNQTEENDTFRKREHSSKISTHTLAEIRRFKRRFRFVKLRAYLIMQLCSAHAMEKRLPSHHDCDTSRLRKCPQATATTINDRTALKVPIAKERLRTTAELSQVARRMA